jgi:hypothetical protein
MFNLGIFKANSRGAALALGAIVGIVAFSAAAGADLWGLPVVAHIPDPLPLPCRSQNWTNADRICLSWTAPRDNTSHTIAVATN